MNVNASPIALQDSSIVVHCCRLCDAPLTKIFVDLGMSPPCESFLSQQQLHEMEPFYPLTVFVCEQCFLVQLPEHVAPQDIFQEYAYFSSYSTTWVAHAKAYCRRIADRLALRSDSLVVELASNDGYLLQHFLPMGIPVLGIEPAANVAQVATDRGVETHVDFFGSALADSLASDGRLADLIIGNNVLAQVPNLRDFTAGISRLLKPDGIVTLEFPHIQRLIGENQFDTIYHEHYSYFSLVTIEELARRHALKIVDVEELSTHGGSLRVFLAHLSSRHQVSPSVGRLLARERSAGLDNVATYAAFDAQVARTKRRLLSFLIEAKEQGKHVCCYGAPGKGNTLLNYCGIGPDFIDFAVDRNPYKHGRFTPGMHIPIRPVEAIDAARPDYLLILPWNLKAEIVEQMQHISTWGGKFVVPIPELSIIDPMEAVS